MVISWESPCPPTKAIIKKEYHENGTATCGPPMDRSRELVHQGTLVIRSSVYVHRHTFIGPQTHVFRRFSKYVTAGTVRH